MELQITKKQLQDIVELGLTIEATLGGGGDVESDDNSYDEECIKQLRSIKRMLIKNGYKNPFTLKII